MNTKTCNAALYSAPVEKMPKEGIAPEMAYQIVKDETYPQTQPKLNLATFVTTQMDKYALRFSHLGSTKMLCPHNEALEMQLIKILSQTTHYDIDYDMLMLINKGEIIAVFQAQPQENR